MAANPWEDLVEPEVARLGIEDRVTIFTSSDLRVAGLSDPRSLAARLWPLDEVAVIEQHGARRAALAV
ncbi:hypothetical protein LK455_30735 [Nocardia abscessus]|nr:hypothetical protein [Nocardia abscessus]MCC3332048.1 hypothetical protein [Nocardia abscessus]